MACQGGEGSLHPADQIPPDGRPTVAAAGQEDISDGTPVEGTSLGRCHLTPSMRSRISRTD